VVDGEKPGVDSRDEWKHSGVEGTICLPSAGRSVLRVNVCLCLVVGLRTSASAAERW